MDYKIALLILVLFLFPLLMLLGEQRVKLINWISPIILCYAFGILLANLPFISINKDISTTISDIMVPLAIPLLLFSTNVAKWIKGAKSAIASFLLCVLSVTICSTFGAFLFRSELNETWKLAGMLVGVYTGGTPNMSAIGLSLEVNKEAFVLLNASDLVWGATYLLFLMTLAKPLLGKVFKKYRDNSTEEEDSESSTFNTLSTNKKLRHLLLYFGLSILIFAVGVGFSMLLYGSIKAVLIILSVTTIGIALSFNKQINTRSGSYELGEYFLLVFCMALGSLADISELINAASGTLFFTGFVMVTSIILHFSMAYFVGIDRDTVIITSVAGIYGPAFVGPIAKILENKSIILTGMTTGLIGYALGNYLGIALAIFLESFF